MRRKQAIPLKDLGDEAAAMLGMFLKASLTPRYLAASNSYSKCLLEVSAAGNRFCQVNAADNNTFAHALSKLSEIVLLDLPPFV